ncbi:plasmid pRiA4b ORF-3 family protein [Metallibacterium scheffleri]|uniref:plasmid pRiA4b ORF-3 family protein n=1 Tax=Metallibacterium scheffleri TaxID=993689 RepID=UPI0023F23196|nr:plasmid pRiA4b ORF-3 family protein [Metallibacterium scheffleri]
MPKPPRPQPVALRIELLEVVPLVWRRVLVSSHWTLASLHHYLQWVMGWTESHVHEFQVGDTVVAPAWWNRELGLGIEPRPCKDELKVSVAAVAAEVGMAGTLTYVYDMGDHWRHRITVERVPQRLLQADVSLPICLAGENACPPEDVGGVGGYADFLEALNDPDDDQHDAMVRWVGGVFDPHGFDLNRINRDWRPGRRARER